MRERRIAGLILAAGGSRRLGQSKALLRVGGIGLLRRTVDCALAAGLSPLRVVAGSDAKSQQDLLAGLPLELLPNPDWEAGLSTSIRRGLRALAAEHPDLDAVVLMACDQPRLEAGVLTRLVAGFDGQPGRLVACAYAGTVGVPALFERGRFPELLALEGDAGAKSILLAHPGSLVAVPWPDGVFDIDTPADLDGVL